MMSYGVTQKFLLSAVTFGSRVPAGEYYSPPLVPFSEQKFLSLVATDSRGH